MERVAGGTADDFMNSVLATASPRECLDEVLHRQMEMELEDMPVIDAQGHVLGAINLSHVLQYFVREACGEE
jgi:CBS-domain-containing membrane protein